MPNPTLTITTPNDRDIVMTRVFDAPRELVWEALVTPSLVKRWLGVAGRWTLSVCDIDLRVGGKYRYVWQMGDGKEMGMGGTYTEIIPPIRMAATEKFDQSWYPGEASSTIELAEKDGKTTLTLTVRYESKAARDGVMKTPMAQGVEHGYNLLAELLVAGEVGTSGKSTQ